MYDHGHDGSGRIERVVGKRIKLLVIAECKRFPKYKQVTSIDCHTSEHKLHDEQIQSLPPQEHIDISGDEHYGIDFLHFVGDPSHIASL